MTEPIPTIRKTWWCKICDVRWYSPTNECWFCGRPGVRVAFFEGL